MPPQTQPAGSSVQASDGTQLNPLAVNVAKAIRQTESGGDYNAVGDNGTSHGAYQFNKSNFKDWASQYGLDPNDDSPTNQDKVAYARIDDLLKQGRSPSEVAAIWNGAKLVNGKYQAINPAYVEKVKNNYAKEVEGLQQAPTGNLASANVQGYQPPTAPGTTQSPSTVPAAGYAPPTPPPTDTTATTATTPGTDPSGGFLEGLGEDLAGTNPDSIGTQLGNTVKGVGNFLFPSVGDAYHDIKGDSTKTGLQQLGDLGTSALGAATLIPGVDLLSGGAEAARAGEAGIEGAAAASKATSGLLSQVGKNAALGGAYGVTGAVGAGDTDPTKIAEAGAVGVGTGGLLGAAGAGLSKIADVLPQRLVQGVLKNSNPDVADYALTKPMGSPAKMLADSNASLKAIGSQLGEALTHSNVADVVIPSDQIVPKILEQFPNAELTPESLQVELGKIAPLQKSLITKLFTGEGLSIDELHTLNSAIGANTYKMAFDDPTVKAGKDIGNAFYQASKKIITTAAPETESLFDQYSKEIQLNGALGKAVKRGAKSQALNLRDILSLLGGFSAAGPLGAAGAYGIEKAVTSPTVNLRAAGLLNKVSGKGIQGLIAPATVASTGLLNQSLGQ